MCRIRNYSLVLLLLSSFIVLSLADHNWIVLSDLQAEDVPPNLTREASHQLLLKLLSKKKVHELTFELRNEFYTMATGKDFYRLVADDGANKEFHAIAEAVLKLWQKLPYMQIVGTIMRHAFSNATRISHTEGDISKGFAAIKETIEEEMQQPAALYEEYKRLKNEAAAKPLPAYYKIYHYEIPKTRDELNEILAESLNDAYLKKLMVHATFTNATVKHMAHSARSFALAKSILELSKDPQYGVRAQALYDEAVDETAKATEDVKPSNINEKHFKDSFIQIAITFFKTLAAKFENDPEIKAKFAEMKESVSKSR